ncbi:unnamed protein product [Prorocentrum cordatum]|uniref:Uncharacterized protein n=1 Tax=Prorocentrum cordatum TaxID=2364126 RepID=A0ABN9TFW7_9DINO|nr:unnamed protein product [Polarella glacialis]
MIGTLHLHGVSWIGKSRVGKSNDSRTLAWTRSARSIQKKESADDIASLTVRHMSFFKGEPTTDVLPGMSDDGLLQKVTADVLKAFRKPKEEDALLWARLGGCDFEPGSRRQAAANPYDRDAARAALDAATRNKYDLDRFKKIVAPSLEEVKTEEDFNAIPARSHFVVVTDLGVHRRVASADLEDGAEFMPRPNPRAPDLFASEVRDTSSPAARPPPSDNADKMELSTGCMSSPAEGRDVPTVATVRVALMFGDDPGRTASVVGSISGFVEPGAAASASSAPAAASASRSDGAADAPAAAASASRPDNAADAPYLVELSASMSQRNPGAGRS